MKAFEEILLQENFDKSDILRMLDCTDIEHDMLVNRAGEVRLNSIGNKVHGRALIELSNRCIKDCFYCGIRKSNDSVERYTVDFEHVKSAIDLAVESKIGSIAIQSGEQVGSEFIDYVSEIIKYAKAKDDNLGVTLSCGEHKPDTYKKWFDLGAERYLLRIEVSDEKIYHKFHPDNKMHDFGSRIECLKSIKETGFQTGTGVMIGLPGQGFEDLANDVIFMRDFGIHMCGMGPFLPCDGTPLEGTKSEFDDVFMVSLRMIAVMRLIMNDINIVASTAMETMRKDGRMRAIEAGANIIMPNINPVEHRKKYTLYNKIPSYELDSVDKIMKSCLDTIPVGYELGLEEKGNSRRFLVG